MIVVVLTAHLILAFLRTTATAGKAHYVWRKAKHISTGTKQINNDITIKPLAAQ